MREFSWAKLEQTIKNDKDINFLGRVITPLHILGIESLIVHLKSQGVRCKGFILLVPHPDTGLAVSQGMFHLHLYEEVEPIIIEGKEEPAKRIKQLIHLAEHGYNSPFFYLANPFKPELNYVSLIKMLRPRDQLRVVITDEGTANYIRSPYRLPRPLIPGWGLKDVLRFIINTSIIDRFLVRNLKKKGMIKEHLMLEKSGGTWIRNEQVISNFLKVFKDDQVDDDFTMYEGAVIYCPSLLYEAGYLKERKDIEIYEKIHDILSQRYIEIIKPHPREKQVDVYSGLGCMVENRYYLSTETVLANLPNLPKLIIGDFSTVLVTASVFFGIKTIAINKIIDSETWSNKRNINEFNKAFGDFVFIPESFGELKEYLERNT